MTDVIQTLKAIGDVYYCCICLPELYCFLRENQVWWSSVALQSGDVYQSLSDHLVISPISKNR